MLRRILTLISISFVAVFAAEKSQELANVQKSLEKIISKAGIQFSGEFKSQYLPSKIEGSAVNDTTDRQMVSDEFTSVDFDITARPNEMVGARTIFRMHQNWQNFFSDVANPIYTRWLSIDGNVKDMFGFHVGNFKEKYSSLTLYTPEIEVLNEPYIFARQGQIAKDELFLGNNYRNLQGINLTFDAEVVPIFNEFHFGLIGSRLRNIEINLQNGSRATPQTQINPISKYFVGGNVDVTFLNGVNFGLTELFIFDQKSSFRAKANDTITADTLAQRTSVFSLRPGVDIGKIIASDVLTIGLNTEIALSMDDSTSFEIVDMIDSTKDFVSRSINGSAIDIKANVGFSPGETWGVNADLSFISNSNNFRNELAQSPSFIGERILNKENNVEDLEGMYNTFDALYHSIFKFTPARNSNRWAKSPFMATSYLRSIFTQDELASFAKNGYFDNGVQLIMPLGPATPNRVGIKGNVKASLINNGVKVDVLFASLKEAEGIKISDSFSLPKVSFSQIGAGLKIDLNKMIEVFEYPVELSGSYVVTGAVQPALDTVYVENEIQSSFMNIGLYYKFMKRMALIAGYQSIVNTITMGTTVNDIELGNWSLGLEWKVSDGADLVSTFGQMTKVNPGDIGEVNQTMADISLRVKF